MQNEFTEWVVGMRCSIYVTRFVLENRKWWL